jgi:GNAT superfamily N-acetyltransferase
MTIRRAETGEAEALAALINSAFGPAEGFFIVGDRISADGVREHFARGVFLVADDYAGTVFVEPRGDYAYLGLLSVAPARQGEGIGEQLITAAEDFGREHGAHSMDLRVVSLRTDLPPMYRKFGYVEYGTEPWPAEAPPKLPCNLTCMRKVL